MSEPKQEAEVDQGPRERDRGLVARVVALLDLEADGGDSYRAPGLSTEPRPIFGGHIVAQALAAATRTVDVARRVHSLHAYYLRFGTTDRTTTFTVSRDSDGSKVSFRRVVAMQDDKMLLSLGAAFQAPEAGMEHQIEAPQVPPPETLRDDFAQAADIAELPDAIRAMVARASPIRFRSIDLRARLIPSVRPARQAYWFRLADDLPGDDQALQRIVFAYASDMMLLGTALMPHGRRWFDAEVRKASLDHALWIHRDVRVDDWLLYQQESPWAGEGRGLNRGHIFDRAGRLVATVSQEGSMRAKA